jgi:hypothetical protein
VRLLNRVWIAIFIYAGIALAALLIALQGWIYLILVVIIGIPGLIIGAIGLAIFYVWDRRRKKKVSR